MLNHFNILPVLHDSGNVSTIGAQDAITLYNIEHSLSVCVSGCMLNLKVVSLLLTQYLKLFAKNVKSSRGVDLIYCSSV